MPHTSLFASLAHVFQIPLRASPRTAISPTMRQTLSTPLRPSPKQHASNFSTTLSLSKWTKGQGSKPDRRVTMIRYSLHHPTRLMPRPLRFSRMRYLRHWTITRAWSLYRSQQQKTHIQTLEKQYNAMRTACEDLRVNCGEYGARLYRQAMTKKGVFGGRSDLEILGGKVGELGRVEKGREGGVPIEYARGLVDTLGKGGWDEGWRR